MSGIWTLDVSIVGLMWTPSSTRRSSQIIHISQCVKISVLMMFDILSWSVLIEISLVLSFIMGNGHNSVHQFSRNCSVMVSLFWRYLHVMHPHEENNWAMQREIEYNEFRRSFEVLFFVSFSWVFSSLGIGDSWYFWLVSWVSRSLWIKPVWISCKFV